MTGSPPESKILSTEVGITNMQRRDFMRGALAGFAFLALPKRVFAGPQDHQAFLSTLGKDSRMIVHNGTVGVMEAPLELLRTHRVTPANLLFVRNNQLLAGALSLDPSDLAGWKLELGGSIGGTRIVDGGDIRRMPASEVEMVLQCSGTGRSYFAAITRTRGTQWGRGGMGNVRWRGVRIRALLESLRLEVDDSARFVAAEGRDGPVSPEGADFEHSLPLRDVMDRGLLAFEMNGRPIPALHGGPLRLIVPGLYGTMQVKWLSRLRFEADESTNHHHKSRYRTFVDPITPGSSPAYSFENSRPTWGQKLKSIIWEPLEGQSLRAGNIKLAGVAWNDGFQAIESVEVSVDGGQTWRRARLDKPSSRFAWHQWSLEADLSRRNQEIWVRARDASNQTQPLSGTADWNPSGYGWNAVDRVGVTVT